jgi:solute carrier family 8 (sodium/calcium exchanger)
MENAGECVLGVMRSGNTKDEASIKFATVAGTATEGEDYKRAEGTLTFGSGEERKEVSVTLIDDVEWEPDEYFTVELSTPSSNATLSAKHHTTNVTILNDDDPGMLQFEGEVMTVSESCGTARLRVLRKEGSSGTATVKYCSADGSAVAGKDYDAVSGTLTFLNGETEKVVEVSITNDMTYEKTETFNVTLSEPSPEGVKLKPSGAKVTVSIVNSDEMKTLTDNVTKLLGANQDKFKIGTSNWGDQFKNAVTVQGSNDDGSPTMGDYVMHTLSVFWKVLFAIVPPTDFAGGWLCFGVALCMIGVVTAFIGDLAGFFGCVISLDAPITAITFVALGTSLPDTFASVAAATGDEYADASVGNVTGSNSVNVFLGLGLPWTIAAVYWELIVPKNDPFWMANVAAEHRAMYPEGGVFIVPAGALGFSVTVFSICAVVCLLTLVARRKVAGGELGGPRPLKIATAIFFVLLWVTYVLMSSLKTKGIL